MSKVIVDADAIIAMRFLGDSLHQKAGACMKYIIANDMDLIVPFPTVLEATTTMVRKLKMYSQAHETLEDYYATYTTLNYDLIIKNLLAIYDNIGNKNNTTFDYFVLAAAKTEETTLIFSFDKFYKKHGMTLIDELV